MTAAPRLPRHHAFTLPEVLATLLLIGIVVPVAMRGISTATITAGHARNLTEASGLAESKLNEIVATGIALAAPSGDFGPQWPRYRWRCDVYAHDSGLSEVVVEVRWTEGGQDRSYRLATLVYEAEETQ